MIKNTIGRMKDSIRTIGSINNKKKEELIRLLSTLESEIAELSKTHGEHAQSIAGFSMVASHEAIRKEKESHLMNLSLEGLSSSVKGFEVSHPNLVKTVNDICNLLASIGI